MTNPKKVVYPITLTPVEGGYLVYIPDFDVNTEGKDEADAMLMARDAIGLLGIVYEDEGRALPAPTSPDNVRAEKGVIRTLVDVDLADYRRRHDNRTVRRNVTLPMWLDTAASESGINVSAVLQKALRSELKVSGR